MSELEQAIAEMDAAYDALTLAAGIDGRAHETILEAKNVKRICAAAVELARANFDVAHAKCMTIIAELQAARS